MYEIFMQLLQDRGISTYKVAKETGISNSTFSDWKNGRSKPKQDKLEILADYFGVSVDYLLGKTKNRQPGAPIDYDYARGPEDSRLLPLHDSLHRLDSRNIRMIPLFENASAGFGACARSEIVGYIPLYIASDEEAAQTICITVRGDSMYPKIEDGDVIQVHKQASVDSGSIAVVLLDGEEGFVKRVVYGHDWIELQSINPEYQTKRFEGPEILRLQVVGLVKSITKQV